MATATRIYHINMEGVVHLVRASHPNAALMHVARNVASVRVATQDDLINSLADGVTVESAREEPTPEPAMAQQFDLSLPLPPDEGADEGEQAPPGTAPRQRQPAKYRCQNTGSTWSGRGLMPTWLRVALDRGAKLSDFDVTATEPAPQCAA